MDWIIFILVVVWLGIVSWFDIRKSEIPHSAWVIIPLIGACFYRTWQGNWVLVLLTILVAAVSERENIPPIWMGRDRENNHLVSVIISWCIPFRPNFTFRNSGDHRLLGCVGVEVVGRG